MFNNFESALKKGMKSMSTPSEKLAFKSFLAEACRQSSTELGTTPGASAMSAGGLNKNTPGQGVLASTSRTISKMSSSIGQNGSCPLWKSCASNSSSSSALGQRLRRAPVRRCSGEPLSLSYVGA